MFIIACMIRGWGGLGRIVCCEGSGRRERGRYRDRGNELPDEQARCEKLVSLQGEEGSRCVAGEGGGRGGDGRRERGPYRDRAMNCPMRSPVWEIDMIAGRRGGAGVLPAEGCGKGRRRTPRTWSLPGPGNELPDEEPGRGDRHLARSREERVGCQGREVVGEEMDAVNGVPVGTPAINCPMARRPDNPLTPAGKCPPACGHAAASRSQTPRESRG